MSEEPKLSQRYRELPREEPPRHVDEAILAASRRATGSRPAPLVAPAGRRRWYFPLAAAAIIVLAVAVTVHVERQQQDVEVAEAPAAAPLARPEGQPPAEAPQEQASAPARASRKQESFTAQAPAAPAPEQASASDRVAAAATRSPEQWLQGIADLRRQGRHDEAERELAEFRKRFPDYRISEALRERIEKR